MAEVIRNVLIVLCIVYLILSFYDQGGKQDPSGRLRP